MIDYKDSKYKELKNEYDPQFNILKERVNEYYKLTPNESELLQSAYHLALFAHRNQLRRSGEPYFVHLIKVSSILADLKMDVSSIISGLLHDTIEDTFVKGDELKKIFGETITNIIDGVTKIGEISGKLGIQFQQAENIRKMLLSMTNDVRVLIIKLADRMHNMQTLEHMPAKKREKIARETLEVYAPLAHRFGMGKMKVEFEDLAFKFLDNKNYQELTKKVNEKKEEREKYIENVIKPIEEELNRYNKKYKIYGRPKHLYSIHQKIQKRNKKFEELYDLFAIRVIVESIEDCYFTLGIIHQKFIPVYDRFKDYISVPKTNGYQSLHTTVLGSKGKLFEVQIRTNEMHKIAEEGIAAHWLYKENMSKSKNKIRTNEMEESIANFKNLLEDSKEHNSKDFINDLKVELYEDDVFIFTPKGDVFRLPVGSTPIDFAFSIHTGVGMHCLGAKVNNKIVSLKTELNSGEIVEIITSQNQYPREDWLKYVKTSKARNKIKRFLKDGKFQDDAKKGEEDFNKDIISHSMKKEQFDINQIVEKYKLKSNEHFYALYHRSEITFSRVLAILKLQQPKTIATSIIDKIFRRAKSEKSILVDGKDQIDVNFAGCCQPLPGDVITGYITKNKGISVHRKDCQNLIKMIAHEDRMVPVDWEQTPNLYHKAQIYIEGVDSKNLLKDITVILADANSNIVNIEMRRAENMVNGFITLEVTSLDQLGKILNKIRTHKSIKKVERK